LLIFTSIKFNFKVIIITNTKGWYINMEGLLKFSSIVCMCIFTYIGKIIMGIDVNENDKMIYNYIGIISIVIGMFSSGILGYLGHRMSED